MPTRTSLRDVGLPGEPPFTRGIHPTGLPLAALDDAHVRGLRQRGGHQRQVPPAARRRPDRPVHRLRHAHALRLRHGRCRGRGRVRHLRRRGQQPRRHGGAALGPAARPREHLDDDQRPGGADLGDVHRGGREGAASRAPRSRARSRTTSSRSTSPRRSSCSRPTPSMRLVVDTIEFGTRELPRWNTVSISGYHIREAGSTAVQELAFTIADGMAYVEAAMERGLAVDDFAPRLSFFFNSHTDFFEEIAKFRASRRIWWKLMHERYRRRARALDLDALPHPDRGRVADAPAAAQQPDPGRDPGPGRDPRRDAVAPHRRVRRGAGGADRRGRAPRAAPAAGPRRGDGRCRPRWTRSAGRGSWSR